VNIGGAVVRRLLAESQAIAAFDQPAAADDQPAAGCSRMHQAAQTMAAPRWQYSSVMEFLIHS
jgi:hypothetical protein